MIITCDRLNETTARITAHLPNGETDFVDVPRKTNVHDIIDFVLRVGDKQ